MADLRELIVTNESWDDLRSALRNGGYSRLVFNQSLGYERLDIEILSGQRGIESLSILCPEIADLSPICSLSSLKDLSIQRAGKTLLNVNGLKELRRLVLHDSPGVKGWEQLTELVEFHCSHVRPDELELITNLVNLEKLVLNSVKAATLNFMKNLQRLQFLELAYVTGTAVRSLSSLSTLKVLEIYNCSSLASLEFLEANPQLEELVIMDCGKIKTLSVLSSISALKKFVAGGSTIIEEGGLLPILQVPTLVEVRLGRKLSSETSAELAEKVILERKT